MLLVRLGTAWYAAAAQAKEAVMASDIETIQGPLTTTPELATRILCRALRLVDFVHENGRLSEYAHWEYEQYADFAQRRGMPVPSEKEVANVSVSELAFLKNAIQGILCAGTAPSRKPEIGMYL
jgi:hypothetical protein